MEIALKDAKFFKQCIDAIVNIVDEGTFEVSSEGLHLRSLDASQIAMVDFRLPKGTAFSNFDSDGVRYLSLNLLDLSKILARSRGQEKLTIRAEEKENKISFEFVSDAKRSFKTPVLDLKESAMPREPKVTFDVTVKIRATALKEALKDASLVSSHVQMDASDGKLSIEAHGDSGDMASELGGKSAKEIEVTASTPSKAMYPAEYLDKMAKAAVDSEPVTLEFGNNKPIRMSYKIGDAQLVYYLAPRVESE